MAPLKTRDDFILTISDDDNFSVPEEREEIQAAHQSRKRKREGEDEKPNGTQIEGRSRKKKRQDSSTETHSSKFSAQINGEGDESDDGQDDGAMDSDFEFQIGEADEGILKDFDGWGLANTLNGEVKKGNKKGVDIDEIIARRRKPKDDVQESDEESNQWDGLSADESIDEESDDGSTENEIADNGLPEEFTLGDEEEEDDELLAPDGFGMGATSEDEGSDIADEMIDPAELDNSSESENGSVATPVRHPLDDPDEVDGSEESEDQAEKARQEAFFAPETEGEKVKPKDQNGLGSFQLMSLSRPILRGLATVGFSHPTPIQTKTIPVALLGKDIVGGAVTGSGKTAAFVIPILERLLYRPKKIATSRVVILMPTRELAVQCYNVAKKLASFTDITFCQLVGGFSLREQESVLKKRPDVIIATPGRFIDHMRNSASFTVDTIEILVLDEADRMLEDGFADELNEILTTLPKSRQSMLFSATMTSNIDNLIRVGLNRPVRLLVDPKRQTVGTLTQEFLRLRPGREDKRLAYLLHLCSEIFTDRCIIFLRQKKEAHRLRIVFGLFGFKVAELHGSMTQEQRIASVESFRAGSVTHLLATDVASRGLDIKGVETVLNYEAPQSLEIYLHRVGRTARAGRTGRACTLAAELDRKVVKVAVKTGKAQGAKIVSRIVDNKLADEWAKKIDDMEEEVEAILKEEKEEKALAQVDMQVKKGENIIDHEAEIMARPKRTWFETEKEKRIAKKVGREELNGPSANSKKKQKEGKLSEKDKKQLDIGRERREGKVWKKGRTEREAKEFKAGGRGGPSKAKKKDRVKVKANSKSKSKGRAKGR